MWILYAALSAASSAFAQAGSKQLMHAITSAKFAVISSGMALVLLLPVVWFRLTMPAEPRFYLLMTSA
jgi:hypothetical protein